jgi:hypothetical protein
MGGRLGVTRVLAEVVLLLAGHIVGIGTLGVGVRPSFERETGTPSWREDQPGSLGG